MTEKLTVSIDINKIVVPAALEYIEAAFVAGWEAGNSLTGTLDLPTEWDRYRTDLIGDEEVAPVGPLTLDDVSKRMDAICEAHLERCKDAQTQYSAELDALAAAVEASPDINQNAVGIIVLGRVKTLMTEVEKAIG